MVLQPRLANLQYGGWEKLEAASELPSKTELRKLTSSRAFTHVKKLYDKAEIKRKDGDEEEAYIFYNRTCEVTKMIMEKRDFRDFKETPDCRLLYRLFEESLSRFEKLKESLTERYKLQEAGRSLSKSSERSVTENFNSVHEEIMSKADIGFTIVPRELKRAIESNKKVLIIDYRSDRSSSIKYEVPGRVFITRVPSVAIVPGCISSTLIRSADISDRAALQRMSDVDLVVLVGPENPVLKPDGPIAGSVEQILFDALFMYNNNFRLQRRPVFLDGGFPNWAMHYPMHIKTESGTVDNLFGLDDRSEFMKLIAEYRKAILDVAALSYPDLQHRPRKVPTTLSNDVMKKSDVFPSSSMLSSAPEKLSQSSFSQTNLSDYETSVISKIKTSSGSKENTARSHSLSTSQQSQAECSMKSSSVMHSENITLGEESGAKGVTGVKRVTKHEALDVENNVDKRKVKRESPSVDRTKKPQTLVTERTIPTVDRSTKPKVLLTQQEEVSEKAGLKLSTSEKVRPVSPAAPQAKARGGARPETILPPTPPAIPDRSKKPFFVLDEDDQLLQIYEKASFEIDAAAIKGQVRPGYTGLRNLKNTCYMNATLQALLNTIPLRRFFRTKSCLKFVNRKNSKGTQGVCSAVFSALMNAVWSGNYSVINPCFFRLVFVSEVSRDFNDHEQHDAQEFQIFLLAALHEDMDQVQSPKTFQQDYKGENLQKEALEFETKWRLYTNSPVNDIFRCITVSVKRCGTCNGESVSFEEITQLSVAISEPSLRGCIAAHFEKIFLEGDSKWKCPKCKVYRDSYLKTDIWKAPEILVVHLKRSSDGINKNDALVTFDVGPLSMRDCMHHLAGSDGSYYSLYTVINHMGSLNSGHYTAYVQNVQEDGNKQWLVCDDDVIRPIDENALCTKNAVVLYFRKNTVDL